MEFHQLRTFVAVAELQHLTQAAERLHVSQPTASAHIKAMEESLGLILFERRAKGLALTPAGRELFIKAQEVLAASAALLSHARRISGAVEGPFRIGLRLDMQLIPLGSLCRRIRAEHPALKIELSQLSNMSIVSGLRGGELDAGITLVGQLPKGIHGVELKRVTYRIAAPAEWRDAVVGAAPEALAALPWIGAPQGGSHEEMLSTLLGDSYCLLNRVVESDHEAVHAALVEAGVGLALMRQEGAAEAESRGRVSIWEKASVETCLQYIYAEHRSQDPAVRAVAGHTAAFWATG